MNPAKLPLAEIVERCEHLLRLSPADATIISWIESSANLAIESTRSRRAEATASRMVVVRVREGRRTGLARCAASDVGELQLTLRQALAVARAASISPEWEWPRGSEEAVSQTTLDGLHDAEVAELAPPATLARLQQLADRQSTLRCSWSELHLVIAATGRPIRAARATEISLEARTGRRPGSGFAAASSRTLRGLAFDKLVANAQALQATEITEEVPNPAAPAVLAPEAAVALLELVAREVFSGRRFVAGQGPLADPAERRPLSPLVRLVDEPGDELTLGFPFDYDGLLKRRRELVHDGELAGPVLDLELAARCGRLSTGHGVAGEDAVPGHPQWIPGEASEEDLLRRSPGGIRVGSIENLRCLPGPGLPFRGVARSVRRIGPNGKLEAALPPLIWTGKLLDLLAAVDGAAGDRKLWIPGLHRSPAVAPALRLAAVGELQPSREGRG
ncbi:MAG: metallopeptidase TldD-related protein [Thermoanaerobaculia bacterium]